MKRMISEREREVLEALSYTEWLRPMDIGGRDGSHHSATLAKLVARGIVERRSRSAWQTRGSYRYLRLDCPHDLNDNDQCEICGEDFATHLALKGAGLL